MKIKIVLILAFMSFSTSLYADNMDSPRNILLMKSQFINDEELWSTFDKFFKKIKKSHSIGILDRLENQVDAWNTQLESSFGEQHLVEVLCFLLIDEVKRSEKRLYIPRGKGRQPDWRNNLAEHSRRLEMEKLIIEEIADFIDKHKIVDASKWKIILNSFQFSNELVAANIEQVEREIVKQNQTEPSEYFQTLKEKKKLLENSRILLSRIRD